MYAVLKVDSSWLADPLNNTHRKVYLGPPLSSLSPFLSYVLLLCLIDSRSASSSVASLNTVRISKKNTGSSNTSSCHECLKAHLFHGNLSNSITLSPLKTVAHLNPLWRKKTMYKRPSLFISASWNVDDFQAWKMMKVQKYWQNSKTGTFHNTHLRESISFGDPTKKNMVDCLSPLCWQIFGPALGHDIWRDLPAHSSGVSSSGRVEIRASRKKLSPKRRTWWSWC